MHNHLVLVKATQPTRNVAAGEIPHLPDMDIILAQALLMDAGSKTFKAIKSGEMADILVGLVELAHAALQTLAKQNEDVAENPRKGSREYQMIAIMRLLSDSICRCSSGEAKHFSDLYHQCAGLATDFLNADFNKAFQTYHAWREDNDGAGKAKHLDLTDCLFE